MKVLNVIESAYRGSLEEQDDTIVWLSHTLNGVGADLGVLLRANAVNYAVEAQNVTPLKFGDRQQNNAPDLAGEVAGLCAKGVPVYVVREDLAERGIDESELVAGIEMLARPDQPSFYQQFDLVWHW